MSNIIKLLTSAFIFCCMMSANAQDKDGLDQYCTPLLKNKCNSSKCMDTNRFIDFIYDQCKNNTKDIAFFNTPDLLITPNSPIGYLIKFGDLSISTVKPEPIESYSYYKKEYQNLRSSYETFSITNLQDFLSSMEFLKTKKETQMRDKFIGDYESVISKINSRISTLDFMFTSEDSFKNYRNAHAKFMPYIISNKESFKNKEFSLSECSFLNIRFDKEQYNDLQKEINFTCEK